MSKIGVYIDADNISPSHAEVALRKLCEEGEIVFAKAFANWCSKPPAWKELIYQYAVEANHRYNITRSKNAADMALTVDAIASLYGNSEYDVLAVVSSDCDFLPLVHHANKRGMKTVGFGLQKAPKPYTDSCKEFFFLDKCSSGRETLTLS